MARESRGVVKINIYVNANVFEALRRIAAVRGCSYSELIREACRQYVLSEGPKVVDQQRAVREIAK